MNRHYVHDWTLFESGLLSLITVLNIPVITCLMRRSSFRFDRQGRCLIKECCVSKDSYGELGVLYLVKDV